MDRLKQLPTLRIDPSTKRRFTFEGQPYVGLAGDTIATALYANGVRIFSRSLKYHRPRGLYSLDGESSNTYVGVDGIPNVCAEKTLLQTGMTVGAQNVKGTPEKDFWGFMDRLDWAMPAGFYYRTLHKPAFVWPFAMKHVRRMAGLGKISPDFDKEGQYDEIYPQTDVCVVGGGPAGMAAALAAAGRELQVILIEQRPWLGGGFDHRVSEHPNGMTLYARAKELSQAIEAHPYVRVFTHTAMVGTYNNNLITAFQIGNQSDQFDERYMEIRARSVIVASGCIERPLLFENNERPGVMQIGCAHRLARTYGLLPGEKAVFSIGHDLGLEAAVDLHDLGLNVVCVADTREAGQAPRWIEALQARHIPFLQGWTAVKAHGKKRLKGVSLGAIQGPRTQDFTCDVLIASAGMTPQTGALTMAGAKQAYDPHSGFFLPVNIPDKIHPGGRLLGLYHPQAIEASGRQAGLRAAIDCGAEVGNELKKTSEMLDQLPQPEQGSRFVRAPGNGRKCFVCFDEDTTLKNVDQGLEMGFDVPELIKRFTAAGTGPGQGGIAGHNLPLYVAQYNGETLGTHSPSTVRAPLIPVYMGTYAGANHDMCKLTPVHASQTKAGGIMRRMGVWKRARYFSEDFSCREEILNVRQNVGLLDASTLGKFRLWGPDALSALQRVYVGDMSQIPPGKVKYSAMCNDDGCIVDDGVVAQRGDNDYYFTSSTARAGSTVEWIRYHTRYDGWNFHMVNLTDALGVINVAGPKARRVLEKIADTDLDDAAFPYTGYREFTIRKNVPVRAMRLGFVGELSYELHVPSSYMQRVWDLLVDAGAEFGIRNFGIEAQNVLRMEKGHIIIGSESEQRTTLHDVGLGFLWFRHKPEAKTIGAVALQQTEHQENRLKLVGFKMENPAQTPRDGALIEDTTIRGHVCTSRYSFSIKASVGLALVEEDLSEVGNRLAIFEDGAGEERLYARVVPRPFYDPGGTKLRG